MVTTRELTEAEARVIWTALTRSWAPMVGYREYMNAMEKLCAIGKGYACRDCTDLGRFASHYGGFVCAEHKAAEDRRFAEQEDAERKAAQ